MKNLNTVCLFLCAVTIYAQIDFQKYVAKSCIELTKEFTNNEKCKDYQLPDYLHKAKNEFKKTPANNQPKILEVFDTGCCVMESLGFINTDATLDMQKVKDYLSDKLKEDDDMNDKVCSCVDEEIEYTPEEDRTIDQMQPVLNTCVMCNCLNPDVKKLLKKTFSCD